MSSEALKYRNMLQSPLPFGCPTHGAVSLPGKATIWLWPEDRAHREVDHCIRAQMLRPWPDGEAAPARPGAPPVIAVAPAQLDAAPAAGKRQTLAAVLQEGPEVVRATAAVRMHAPEPVPVEAAAPEAPLLADETVAIGSDQGPGATSSKERRKPKAARDDRG